MIRQADGTYLSEQEVELHLLIKDIASARDMTRNVMSAADRSQVVKALIAAGYSKPFQVQFGKYRNRLDVEIEVIDHMAAPHVIGPVFYAVRRDSLFGDKTMIVTPEGMRDAGYVRVEGQ